MQKTILNQEIIVAVLLFLKYPRDRYWAKMYYQIQQHPSLNQNHNNRYPDAIFQEGIQEAWATFSKSQIQKIFSRCEAQDIEIYIENSDRLVSELIKYLNTVIRNKTIDIWRKETYLVA